MQFTINLHFLILRMRSEIKRACLYLVLADIVDVDVESAVAQKEPWLQVRLFEKVTSCSIFISIWWILFKPPYRNKEATVIKCLLLRIQPKVFFYYCLRKTKIVVSWLTYWNSHVSFPQNCVHSPSQILWRSHSFPLNHLFCAKHLT